MDWFDRIAKSANQASAVGAPINEDAIAGVTRGALEEQYSRAFTNARDRANIEAKVKSEDKALAFEREKLTTTSALTARDLDIKEKSLGVTKDYYNQQNDLYNRRIDIAEGAQQGQAVAGMVKGGLDAVGMISKYGPKVKEWFTGDKGTTPETRIGVSAAGQQSALSGGDRNPYSPQYNPGGGYQGISSDEYLDFGKGAINQTWTAPQYIQESPNNYTKLFGESLQKISLNPQLTPNYEVLNNASTMVHEFSVAEEFPGIGFFMAPVEFENDYFDFGWFE